VLLQKELNLGILAHVDAGKTTLTERLLYEAGAIDRVGSVDAGTTTTDFLALERQRGITIRSAVASFALEDVHVNLIDTPGHPDFIAEVERVLSVLDGAVLVVSAVEGVQPQTRVLMRALKRLRVPTLVFVNKTDRMGADVARVRRELVDRLGIALGDGIEALAENDDALFAAYVDGTITGEDVRAALREQTGRGLVHPVVAGSAITGEGIAELMHAIADLLPAAAGDPDAPVAASVFKIERAANGEKVAYVRVFDGTIRVRDKLDEDKVTALAVFARGGAAQAQSVSAGGVAKVWGLAHAQVGRLGERAAFPPPTLEAVVSARHPADRARLRTALTQLAEQDPLIDVRQNEEFCVSLYGEVQQEVLEATLADDYGLDVAFSEPTTICVERPLRAGEHVELLHAETNPFSATVGLLIEPAAAGTGLEFRLDVATPTIPLYVYKSVENFRLEMRRYVGASLEEGLFGWRVTDCVVTMTHCGYSSADGPPSQRGPLSMPGDYRGLTPLVLRRALEQAGTVVCEPIVHVTLEVPTATVGAVIAALVRLGARVETPELHGDLSVVETMLPAARAQELQRQLPGLSRGEGVLDATFAGYEPVAGDPPIRTVSSQRERMMRV
jgi:ribosomal protection tetracycline resistance protein